ncbi:hypothetical protein [Sphingomonas sp. 22176]|uniref:hypothetical protein n=1 Tax=Sphingomonas sp. 22176 TaxID=3453884 RepID=UPI003F86A08A
MAEVSPSFHDGYMTGIAVGEGTATLSLKRANGEAWQLRLTAVQALKMDDFSQGNIILSLETFSSTPLDGALIERLYEAPHPSVAAKYRDAHLQLISRKMAMIEGGEATLLVLTPSYGADLVALCGAVTCELMPTDVS